VDCLVLPVPLTRVLVTILIVVLVVELLPQFLPDKGHSGLLLGSWAASTARGAAVSQPRSASQLDVGADTGSLVGVGSACPLARARRRRPTGSSRPSSVSCSTVQPPSRAA
jgi:hypothetical protein